MNMNKHWVVSGCACCRFVHFDTYHCANGMYNTHGSWQLLVLSSYSPRTLLVLSSYSPRSFFSFSGSFLFLSPSRRLARLARLATFDFGWGGSWLPWRPGQNQNSTLWVCRKYTKYIEIQLLNTHSTYCVNLCHILHHTSSYFHIITTKKRLSLAEGLGVEGTTLANLLDMCLWWTRTDLDFGPKRYSIYVSYVSVIVVALLWVRSNVWCVKMCKESKGFLRKNFL